MLDALADLLPAWRAGEARAVATVVATWSSAPRPPGAALVVAPDGAASGGVSGGCVEGDVHARALEVLGGAPPALLRYGVAEADALAAGLPCGGEVEVLLTRVDRTSAPHLGALADAVAAGAPVALVTVVEHPDAARRGLSALVPGEEGAPVAGGLGDPVLDAAAAAAARRLLRTATTAAVVLGAGGEPGPGGVRVLVECAAPRPRLLVAGAGDLAAALARQARLLGLRTTVVDARPVFTTAARHPDADEVVVDWPHRHLAAQAAAGGVGPTTAVVALTHDERFDVPLLATALALDLGYVGAMGSRRTCAARRQALRERGVAEAALARLRAPVGLDLGGATPAELALSVLAEVVAARAGRSGLPLSVTGGPLHARPTGPHRAAGRTVSAPVSAPVSAAH